MTCVTGAGLTQLVIEGEKPVESLVLESVVEVTGKVTKEDRSPYGNIEIKVKEIEVISHAESSPACKYKQPA